MTARRVVTAYPSRAAALLRRRTAKRRRAADVTRTLCVSGVKHCGFYPACHHRSGT